MEKFNAFRDQVKTLETFLQAVQKATLEDQLHTEFSGLVKRLRGVGFYCYPTRQKRPLCKFEREEDKIKANSKPIETEASLELPSWLCVVDIDDPETFCELYGISREEVEKVATVRTRRGYHIYLFDPEAKVGHRTQKGGWEVKRGHNVLCVLPGSRMADPDDPKRSVRYEVLNPKVYPLEELPQWLLRVLEEAKREKAEPTKALAPQRESFKGEVSVNWNKLKEKIARFYVKGQRQFLHIYLAGWLYKNGVPKDQILSFAEDLALTFNDEELDMRLKGVKATLEKNPDEVKGWKGLTEELDILEEEKFRSLKEDLKKELEACIVKKKEEGHKESPDDGYIRQEGKIIGPALTFKAKISSSKGVSYLVSFDGQDFVLEKIHDLKRISEHTGRPIPRETSYKSWLAEEVSKPLPVIHKKEKTGWEGEEFIHPLTRPQDIWKGHILEGQTKPVGYEAQIDLLKASLESPSALLILLASSFASVLLYPQRVTGFSVLVMGPSGVGKTLASTLAVSLFYNAWGISPSAWATPTGLERLCYQLTDLPVLLDEMALSSVEAERMVFQVASGTGKLRSTKKLGLDLSRLRNVVFMTSEITEIETFTRAGALRRVLPVIISHEREWGPFGLETLKSFVGTWAGGIDLLAKALTLLKNDRHSGLEVTFDFQSSPKVKMSGPFAMIASSLFKAIEVLGVLLKVDVASALGYCEAFLRNLEEEFTHKRDPLTRFLEVFPQFLVSYQGYFLGLTERPLKVWGSVEGR